MTAARRVLRAVAFLVSASPAAPWISISQAKYGAQLDDLAKATRELSCLPTTRSQLSFAND